MKSIVDHTDHFADAFVSVKRCDYYDVVTTLYVCRFTQLTRFYLEKSSLRKGDILMFKQRSQPESN